jgi:hypothetical protein
MNEFLELLPVPAERDMPAGCFEQRKAALLRLVEADLEMGDQNASRLGRLRGLRAWLTLLGVILALVAVVSSTLLTTHVRAQRTQVVVEAAVVLGSGPVIAALTVTPWTQRRAIGSGRATGWVFSAGSYRLLATSVVAR